MCVLPARTVQLDVSMTDRQRQQDCRCRGCRWPVQPQYGLRQRPQCSFDFVDHPDRVRHPLIKNKETGEFEQATWEEALDYVAKKFTELRDTYGGDSLAGFACARSANEDIYMLQKMVRTAFPYQQYR